jgi:hypothetical protein
MAIATAIGIDITAEVGMKNMRGAIGGMTAIAVTTEVIGIAQTTAIGTGIEIGTGVIIGMTGTDGIIVIRATTLIVIGSVNATATDPPSAREYPGRMHLPIAPLRQKQHLQRARSVPPHRLPKPTCRCRSA